MFVNSAVSYTRNAWIETTQGKKKILFKTERKIVLLYLSFFATCS